MLHTAGTETHANDRTNSLQCQLQHLGPPPLYIVLKQHKGMLLCHKFWHRRCGNCVPTRLLHQLRKLTNPKPGSQLAPGYSLYETEVQYITEWCSIALQHVPARRSFHHEKTTRLLIQYRGVFKKVPLVNNSTMMSSPGNVQACALPILVIAWNKRTFAA